MKTDIEIDYIITETGHYVGWAKDYTAVVAQAEDLDELKYKIKNLLKALFSYFINKIDNDNVKIDCSNVTSHLKT